jgi:tetratricopeptide repeat protein
MPTYSVFIVRPFGVKEGIDFDAVQRDLIEPALKQLRLRHGVGVTGGTTGEITKQGNIRTDMFRLLITSDLVIADVSIHNANVFYELGIRHGLQERHTVLLRSAVDKHNYPFDLQSDRYFLYRREDLGGDVDKLVDTLRTSLADSGKDSPVFALLPKLRPHSRAELMPAPREFQDDIDLAVAGKEYGKLRLLAHELEPLDWRSEGLRLVGVAQFKLKANPGARETFEALRATDPTDLLAHQRLGTIYQRLARSAPAPQKAELLTLSDQRIRRALELGTNREDRAEANSLLGSNAKTRWIEACLSAAAPELHKTALGSPWLGKALDAYLEALRQRLDDHYPAINVLGLLKCQLALAELLTDVWEAQCKDEQDAANQLQIRKRTSERTAALLELALARDAGIGQPADYNAAWALSSEAELILLTQPNRTERVKAAYRKALDGADLFTVEATRRNLEVYHCLGLFEPNTTAALDEIATLNPPDNAVRLQRVVLFTGHMVDRVDRKNPRFPRSGKAQGLARELIREALANEAAEEQISLGIAGGACGSDILFHELCEEAKIGRKLMLALPQDQFQVASVQHGNADWVERYTRLCEALTPIVLQDSVTMPNWLAEQKNYDIWQRNNLWMMFTALTYNARNLTLIALYNPDLDPDGPGGTRHLLEQARQRNFKIVELDARKLLA